MEGCGHLTIPTIPIAEILGGRFPLGSSSLMIFSKDQVGFCHVAHLILCQNDAFSTLEHFRLKSRCACAFVDSIDSQKVIGTQSIIWRVMHGKGLLIRKTVTATLAGDRNFVTVDPLVQVVDRGSGCGGMLPCRLDYGHNFMNSVMI
jgi:hypothetical protein